MSEGTQTPQEVVELVYEYEVWQEHIEKFFELPRFNTKEEAEGVARQLEAKLGIAFFVREIILNAEPIPPKAERVTSITVHEARKMMAKHAMDVLVCVGWAAETSQTNIITAGSNRQASEWALELGTKIGAGMGLKLEQFNEDRRDEHPS